MFRTLTTLVISCGFFSCSSPVVYEQIVRSPVPEQDVPFIRVELNADSVMTVELTTGTQVRFEPSSFETMDGKLVKGKIELRVREFQSAIDLLRAGIPMSVDEKRQSFLQSAGMLEVRASQGGSELKLRNGSTGAVELAGFRPADGYSLYQLGEDVRWRVTDTFISKSNKRKQDRLCGLEESRMEYGLREDAFELVADLSEVPYLKPYKGLLWKPVGSGKKARDFAEAMRYSWDSVRVEPVQDGRKRFRLLFVRNIRYQNDSMERRTLVVWARPVLRGRSTADLLREVEANNRKIEEEQRRVMAEADMVNAFTIRQLGIWNIDRVKMMENRVMGSAFFDFQKGTEDLQTIMLYVVYDKENMVIPVHARDWANLQLLRDTPIRFFAVLPGNRTVVTDYDQIKAALNSGAKEWRFRTRLATPADWKGRG